MKNWRLLLLVLSSLVLLAVTACSKGIPQEQYDKATADLAVAQAQVQKLQSDMNEAQAQIKALQTEVSAGKEGLDKAQGILTTVQPYARLMDLFLESQRQEIGLKPKYWQYTQDYVQSELAKVVEALKDPTLQAFADAARAEGGGGGQAGSRLVLYDMATIYSILSGEGVPTAVPPRAPTVVSSPDGGTIIRVKLLQMDGKPIPNMGIQLRPQNVPPGASNAGAARTDASGTAVFRVSPWDYAVDYDGGSLPITLISPPGRNVSAQQGMTTEVEIRAFAK
ncbi:MAG: hypothetical protein V1724_09070 [Chloroflexota bacterium]